MTDETDFVKFGQQAKELAAIQSQIKKPSKYKQELEATAKRKNSIIAHFGGECPHCGGVERLLPFPDGSLSCYYCMQKKS